jgi:hypothetical protein
VNQDFANFLLDVLDYFDERADASSEEGRPMRANREMQMAEELRRHLKSEGFATD